MGIAERRIRQKEEVRAAILSTAWQLVKKEGWQSLSIRKIADAIEYSVPVIYDHFKNKEAIVFEFAKEGIQLLAKKMMDAKSKHEKPEDQIRAMADAYWNFAFRNKEHYRLMFGLGMATCETGQCMMDKALFRTQLMEPIETLLARNKNTEASACMKYYSLLSVMHGLVSIKLSGDIAVSDEDVNKFVLEDAVDGFIKNLKH